MTTATQFTATKNSLQQEHRVAARMWEHVIESVPFLLGKLVLVASLRNHHSGQYSHPAIKGLVAAEVENDVLSRSHEQIFAEWIGLFLEEQQKAVYEYLASLPGQEVCSLLNQSLESLAPASAMPAARLLFLTDFQTVLDTLPTLEVK